MLCSLTQQFCLVSLLNDVGIYEEVRVYLVGGWQHDVLQVLS